MRTRQTFVKRAALSLTVLLTTACVSAEKPDAVDAAKPEKAPVELKVADRAPDFEGTTDEGRPWKLSDAVGKRFVVVYFYPADFTTGCTKQAETWRDNMNQLVEKDIEVIGISADTVRAHKLFKKVWSLNFTLLADEKAEIARKFGMPIRRGGRVRPRDLKRKLLLDEQGQPVVLERQATFFRWTFVIGLDGKIAYVNRRVHPVKDSVEVLKVIETLRKPGEPVARTGK